MLTKEISTSTDRQVGLFLALSLPVFTACIDIMAISVALNNIMHGLSTSINTIQWLLSGYTIGTAIFLIIIGKIADIYGRKKILILGNILFLIASLVASFSYSINLLIICRILQGIASAMMITSSISIITHHFAPQERGPIIANWGSILGLGMAIGPLIGGLILYFLSWRAIFALNVPICLIAHLLIIKYAPESKDELIHHKIDWVGTFLLTILMLSLAIILSDGNSLGWTSSTVYFLLSIFFVSLVAFITFEYLNSSPLIDYTLFSYRNFSAASFCGFASYFCMYAWLFIFSLYLQNTYGMSPLNAGFLCSSFSIAFALGAKFVGKVINKIGYKYLITIGFILAITAFLWMKTTTLTTQSWQFVTMFFLLGIAITSINAPSLSAATQHLPANNAGIASAVMLTMRWLGGSIGIAIVTLVFQLVSKNYFIQYLYKDTAISISQKNIFTTFLHDNNIESLSNNLINTPFHLIEPRIKMAMTTGLSACCTTLAIVAFIGFLCATFFIRSPKLKVL